MNLNIEKILDIYKKRVSDLEHELILLATRCEMLEEELNKKDNSNTEL